MLSLVSYQTFKSIKNTPGQKNRQKYDLDYKCIEFSVSKKCNCKSGQKNNICLNVFCYKNDLTYPVYVSNNKKNENCIDLFMITDENMSHYIYIKYYDLCATRQEIKINIFLQILFSMFQQ